MLPTEASFEWKEVRKLFRSNVVYSSFAKLDEI